MVASPVLWAARIFSVLWVALAVLAPLLTAAGLAGPARGLYQLQHAGCSQVPAHSTWVCGHPTGLCARHLAIYTMLAVGTLAPTIGDPRRHIGISFPLMLVGLVPIAIDGVLQLAGVWTPNLATRLTTGAIAGLALGLYLRAASSGSRRAR